MKKIIQALLIVILILVLALLIVVIFNPFGLRTKMVGGMINSYLSESIENYKPLEEVPAEKSVIEPSANKSVEVTNDKHPLLNAAQEKTLESYGVNIEQLPQSITPGMEVCFIEKLGLTRAREIVAGDTPGAVEFLKAKDCLGK